MYGLFNLDWTEVASILKQKGEIYMRKFFILGMLVLWVIAMLAVYLLN